MLYVALILEQHKLDIAKKFNVLYLCIFCLKASLVHSLIEAYGLLNLSNIR
jgi:hypothetical protein